RVYGLAMRMCSESDPDESFFRGLVDTLAPFELPVATFHSRPGQFPWYELDHAGRRLGEFGHRFGSYAWTNDPRQEEQEKLLRELDSGRPDDPVAGDYEFLWHCLYAVVRAERFNEGLVANNLLALT